MDLGKAMQHWRLAHKHFGDAYCTENHMARSSVAGISLGKLEDRLDYYRWIRKLRQECYATNLWPHPTIAQAADGLGPVFPPGWRESFARGVPEHLASAEEMAIDAVLLRHGKDPEGLRRAIKEFPGTPLAEAAKKALGGYLQGFPEQATTTVRVASVVSGTNGIPAPVRRVPLAGRYTVLDQQSGRWPWIAALAACIVLMLIGAFMVGRSARRH
jgi:hypothetical protein